MAKFRLKPVKIITVTAEQWFPSKQIKEVIMPAPGSMTQFCPYINIPEAPETPESSGGIVFIKSGDWIVINETTNEKKVVKDKEFKTSYEPTDIAAHNAFKKSW